MDRGDAEREVQELYLAAYVEQLAMAGIPRAMSRRLAFWPSIAIDIDVADVFNQTPGPQAGTRMGS